MTIRIRQANLSDRPAIGCFLVQTYGPLARFKSEARWNWQFIANPFFGGSRGLAPVWIAEDDRRIVGQIAVQPTLLQIDRTEHSAGWIVDVMILPSHRGRALGHRLHDEVAASSPLLITLTMAPATRRIALRAGCVTLGSTSQFTKLLNTTSDTVRRFVYARTVHRPWVHRLTRIACAIFYAHLIIAAMVNAYVFICKRNERLQNTHDQTEIVEVGVFGDEVDNFWERVRREYPAIAVRDSRFLNWRFFNCPHLHYRCFVARRSESCVGYLVLRRTAELELPLGIIVDFLVHPNDTTTVAYLIGKAKEIFGDDVTALDCVTSLPQIEAVLRKFGFLRTRTVHATVVCQNPALRQRIRQLHDRWYFTKGDHDWDQIHIA